MGLAATWARSFDVASAAWLLAALLVACACRASDPPVPAAAAERRTPSHVEPARWLVLGDSIAWDGRWAAHLQTWLASVEGEAAPDVIDCALPSETLACLSEPEHLAHGFPRPCLFERLERVLDAVRPSRVLACYGMNDALYRPFDEERFAAFRAGIERLARELDARRIEFDLLTPPPFDETRTELARGARYDEVLATYSAWLVARRFERGATIDLHAALAQRGTTERSLDPTATISPDGVHLDDRGHLLFACELIAALSRRLPLGAARQPLAVELELAAAADAAAPALELVRLRRDAWLSATGHTRPGLPGGLALADATLTAAALRARVVTAARAENSSRVERVPR